MWQETLGVKVQLAPTEFKVWLDILRTKSFALTADNWNMGINDPSEMLALGVTGDPNNDAGWTHGPYDAAFAAIEKAPDDNARRVAMEACERIISEEVPYAPVFFANRAHLIHPSVRGWRNNALQQIDWTALSLAKP
jgi:oligopeptide transport system substrate-binding protein